jgi:hypothetical protein
MSTKVYNAYKLVNKNDLWPLIRDVKVKATQNIKSVLKNIYIFEMNKVNKDSEIYQKNYKSIFNNPYIKITPKNKNINESRVILETVNDIIIEKYQKVSTSMQRNEFDFDVNVAFYENKNKIYFRHFSDMLMRNVFNFLIKDSRIVDFHYQNQTDQPEHISNREWEYRKKVWDEIFSEPGLTSTYLTLELCNFNMFHQISPYLDILKTIHKNKS